MVFGDLSSTWASIKNTNTQAEASRANAATAASAQTAAAMMSAQASMANAASDARTSRANMIDQLAAQQAIARMQQNTQRDDIRSRLDMARSQIMADLQTTAMTLSQQAAQFQAQFGLSLKQFEQDQRMQESKEFAEPNDWVKQAYYLRGGEAPQGGAMTRVGASPLPTYTPPPIQFDYDKIFQGMNSLSQSGAPSYHEQDPNLDPLGRLKNPPAHLQGTPGQVGLPNHNLTENWVGFAGGGVVGGGMIEGASDAYQTFSGAFAVPGAAGGTQIRATGGDPPVAGARAALVPGPGSAAPVHPVNAINAVNTKGPKPPPPGAIPLEGYSNVAVRVNVDGTKEFYQSDDDGYWVLTSFMGPDGQLQQTGQSGAPSNIQQAVGRRDGANPPQYAPNPAAQLERANQGLSPMPINPTAGVTTGGVQTQAPLAPPAPGGAPAGPPVHGTLDVPPVTGAFERYLQELQNSPDDQLRQQGFAYSNQGITQGAPPRPETLAPTQPAMAPAAPGVGAPTPPAGAPTPEQIIAEVAQEEGVEIPPEIMMTLQRNPMAGINPRMQGFAGGGSVPTAAPGQPLIVGERGPEIVSLPPGAHVVPMDGQMKSGPPPMYNVTPANPKAQDLIGGGVQVPWMRSMMQEGAMPGGGMMPGADSGFEVTPTGNWWATATPPPPAAPPAPVQAAAPASNPQNDAQMQIMMAMLKAQQQQQQMQMMQMQQQLPAAFSQTPQQPGVPPAAPAPPAPTTGGALTGGVQANPAASGTNPLGYAPDQLARMPWLKALSGQDQAPVPAFQGYSGPLSLSDIPGAPGKANPFGAGFPSIPAPHQIPIQQWLRFTPQEKDMALGYYRALGFMPEDVQALMQRQAPGTVGGTPTFWKV
jgi:hypothetical protein